MSRPKGYRPSPGSGRQSVERGPVPTSPAEKRRAAQQSAQQSAQQVPSQPEYTPQPIGLYAEVTDQGISQDIFVRDTKGMLVKSGSQLKTEATDMLQRGELPQNVNERKKSSGGGGKSSGGGGGERVGLYAELKEDGSIGQEVYERGPTGQMQQAGMIIDHPGDIKEQGEAIRQARKSVLGQSGNVMRIPRSSSLSEDEQKALQKARAREAAAQNQSPIAQLKRGFLLDRFRTVQGAQQFVASKEGMPIAENIGMLAGTIPFMLGSGKAKEGLKLGSKAWQSARAAQRALESTGWGLAISRGAQLIATGAINIHVLDTGYDLITDITRGYPAGSGITRKDYNEMIRQKEKAEMIAVYQGGKSYLWGYLNPQGMAHSASMGYYTPERGRAAGQKAMEQALIRFGTTPATRESMLIRAGTEDRERVIMSWATTIFTGSKLTEMFGRRAAAVSLRLAGSAAGRFTAEEAPSIISKATRPMFITLGAGEGVNQYLIQETFTKQPARVKEAALYAGLGGLSSGILGPYIAARPKGVVSPKEAAKGSRALMLGYITDPTEWPGDILQSGEEWVGTKVFKKKYEQPVIFGFGQASKKARVLTSGFALTPSAVSVLMGGASTPAQTQTQTLMRQPTQVQTSTRTRTGINNLINIILQPVQSFVPQPTNPIVPNLNVFTAVTPISINPDVPVTDIVETPAEMPVSTTTNIMNLASTFSVPVVTPQLRIPPPVPLLFGASGRGAGARKGKGVKYVNELAYARSMLAELMGSGSYKNPQPVSFKKITVTKTKPLSSSRKNQKPKKGGGRKR